MPSPLRFLPRGQARVPNYEHQESGRRSSQGWRHDASLGPEFVDPETNQKRNHGGFRKLIGLAHVVEIPPTSRFYGEYIRHLRDGDLWPADIATATVAGVKFDPKFGDEHDEQLEVEATQPAEEN